jgi:hypothetical protein
MQRAPFRGCERPKSDGGPTDHIDFPVAVPEQKARPRHVLVAERPRRDHNHSRCLRLNAGEFGRILALALGVDFDLGQGRGLRPGATRGHAPRVVIVERERVEGAVDDGEQEAGGSHGTSGPNPKEARPRGSNGRPAGLREVGAPLSTAKHLTCTLSGSAREGCGRLPRDRSFGCYLSLFATPAAPTP